MSLPGSRDKLAEAEYFLQRIKETQNIRDAFRYNLSAFLTAASSVIDILNMETNEKDHTLNAWRSEEIETVTDDEYSRVIKKSRDMSVHIKPLNPTTNVIIYPQLQEIIDEALPAGIAGDYVGQPPERKMQIIKENATVIKTTHFFRACKDKNIFSLCSDHLVNLRDLIDRVEVKYNE